jgi:hypothetical protein
MLQETRCTSRDTMSFDQAKGARRSLPPDALERKYPRRRVLAATAKRTAPTDSNWPETTPADDMSLGTRPLPKSRLDWPLGMRQRGTRCFCPLLSSAPRLDTDCDQTLTLANLLKS